MSHVVGEPASTPKPEEAARPKATPRKQSKPGFCRAAGQCTLLFGHQGAHSFELNVGRDRCRKTAVVNMHGSDWRGPVEPTHNERRKQLQKRSSVTLGEQHEVEMLIAKRIADGEPRYLVRWAGKDQKEDSWEKATDIDAAAIEEFTYSKFKSATVKFRKVSQLWLIEQCLDRRIGPPSQSKVRWVGYGKRADQWVNDADIKLPTPAPPTVPSPFPSATSAFSPVDPARAHAREFGAATIASTGGGKRPRPAHSNETAPCVEGLASVMDGIGGEFVHSAALEWCLSNNVQKISLVRELDAIDAFIAELPLNPSGLGAKALRQRLEKMG